MLDSHVTELARTMIQVQFEERRRQLRREVEWVHNEMADRGIGRSGIALTRIHELCAQEVEIRARIVWQVYARVLSTIGVGPSETLAQDLKAEVEAYLPPDLTELNQILVRNADLIRTGQVPTLNDARRHALTKIGAEVDLFVLSLRRRAETRDEQAAPQPVFNFYSQVGVVQTGPEATANVVQNIGSQDREDLRQALNLIREKLAEVERLAGSSRRDVLELVDEAQAEVQKPEPNGLRLTTMLLGIATAIQTVPNIQPAYQAIKAFLSQYGIFLP